VLRLIDDERGRLTKSASISVMVIVPSLDLAATSFSKVSIQRTDRNAMDPLVSLGSLNSLTSLISLTFLDSLGSLISRDSLYLPIFKYTLNVI
jgi:hypothetical protein